VLDLPAAIVSQFPAPSGTRHEKFFGLFRAIGLVLLTRRQMIDV
jgi:hypothetical protein